MVVIVVDFWSLPQWYCRVLAGYYYVAVALDPESTTGELELAAELP